MTAARRQLERVVRHGRDALLLGIAGLLVAAVVHDLRGQVATAHRVQLDERTFVGWARRQAAPTAFAHVRVVTSRGSTDVVCGTGRARPGRTCLAVRHDRHGARVLAAAYVPPRQHAARHGRLICRRRGRPVCVTSGKALPGPKWGGGRPRASLPLP